MFKKEKKYIVLILILLCVPFIMGQFFTSPYGPFWWLTSQSSSPSSPSSGFILYCDANNALIIKDPNGILTVVGRGDIMSVWNDSTTDTVKINGFILNQIQN
jgi:hypothetical protein